MMIQRLFFSLIGSMTKKGSYPRVHFYAVALNTRDQMRVTVTPVDLQPRKRLDCDRKKETANQVLCRDQSESKHH